jgi:predicted RNase H-like HicB family nuclease
MNKSLDERAKILANRPYTALVRLDQTTDGNPIYVATNIEIEGCIAQGETVDEAIANLSEARFDFIRSLLEDDLPVPDPTFLTESKPSLQINYFEAQRKEPQINGSQFYMEGNELREIKLEPSYEAI